MQYNSFITNFFCSLHLSTYQGIIKHIKFFTLIFHLNIAVNTFKRCRQDLNLRKQMLHRFSRPTPYDLTRTRHQKNWGTKFLNFWATYSMYVQDHHYQWSICFQIKGDKREVLRTICSNPPTLNGFKCMNIFFETEMGIEPIKQTRHKTNKRNRGIVENLYLPRRVYEYH